MDRAVVVNQLTLMAVVDAFNCYSLARLLNYESLLTRVYEILQNSREFGFRFGKLVCAFGVDYSDLIIFVMSVELCNG